MSQHAKKKTNSVSQKPEAHIAEVVETADKILEMNREGMENILRTKNFNRITKECVGVCTGALNAGIKSGSIASHAAQKVSNQLVENVNRAISENTELFKKALNCHNASEIAKWQETAWQKTLHRYLDEASTICGLWFDSCDKAIEPLQEQTAHAVDQLRKVVKG